MIETIVPAAIAVITGGFVLSNRISNQMHILERRIDAVELRIAESYVSKQDFQLSVTKMESHLTRIEEKMDKLIEAGLR